MKKIHKILLINAVTGLLFVAGTTFACTPTSCSGENRKSSLICWHGWNNEDVEGKCVDRNIVFRSFGAPTAPFLNSNDSPVCDQNNCNCTILPLTPESTWNNPRYRIPTPPTRITPERIIPPTNASIFEAFWNFITHKRQR